MSKTLQLNKDYTVTLGRNILRSTGMWMFSKPDVRKALASKKPTNVYCICSICKKIETDYGRKFGSFLTIFKRKDGSARVGCQRISVEAVKAIRKWGRA